MLMLLAVHEIMNGMVSNKQNQDNKFNITLLTITIIIIAVKFMNLTVCIQYANYLMLNVYTIVVKN